MLRCHCMSREQPFYFCVSGLWQDGALSLGEGVDPPRSSAGLATGVHIPPPGLRDGAACGEQEKEREGCFGWGWGRRSQQPPQGEGAQREPPLLSGSSHPQFPSLSPAGSRKHAVALVHPGSPTPTPQDTEQDGEWISRGSGSFQPWIHFLWTP